MGPQPAKANPGSFAKGLFTPLPARYDRLEELLSFGQNRRWRRLMVAKACAQGPRLLLDVATGTAGVALQVESLAGCNVVGVDLTKAMLDEGKRRVERAGRSGQIELVLGDADDLPFSDSRFDALCFTYLLRYVPDPAATLRELARVVRPGAMVASLEFMRPPDRFWRSWWWLYTRVVLPLGGLLTGGRAWFDVGRFLGPSISGHYEQYRVEEIVSMWEKAGFESVEARLMSLGGGLVVWGRRSGSSAPVSGATGA